MKISPHSTQPTLPHRLPDRDWGTPQPTPPGEPQDTLAILAQGVVAAGVPATVGCLMGNFGVLLSTAGAAVIGSRLEPNQGAIKGAALGLLAGALGAGMGPGGVLLATAAGSALFLGLNSQY